MIRCLYSQVLIREHRDASAWSSITNVMEWSTFRFNAGARLARLRAAGTIVPDFHLEATTRRICNTLLLRMTIISSTDRTFA